MKLSVTLTFQLSFERPTTPGLCEQVVCDPVQRNPALCAQTAQTVHGLGDGFVCVSTTRRQKTAWLVIQARLTFSVGGAVSLATERGRTRSEHGLKAGRETPSRLHDAKISSGGTEQPA